MNPPLSFVPQSPLIPAFVDVFHIDEVPRRVDVFAWEDRLVAHEEATGLWWATLDVLDQGNPRDFWRHCVQNNRVAKAFSLQRGFDPLRKSDGALLIINERWFDVLVDGDNSGLVKMQGGAKWHTFAATESRRVSKPLAHRPSIWSPRFQIKLARRSLTALHDTFGEEMASTLPPTAQMYWKEKGSAPPLRLVTAALGLEWTAGSPRSMTLLDFWQETLAKRSRALGVATFALPKALSQSLELSRQGELYVWQGRSFGTFRPGGVFCWKEGDTRLYVPFKTSLDSAHEQLEARLELRDWLSDFFPLKQVEAWFAR